MWKLFIFLFDDSYLLSMGTSNLMPEITRIFAPDYNRLDFIWSLELSDRFGVIKLPQTARLAPKLTNLKILTQVVSTHIVVYSPKFQVLTKLIKSSSKNAFFRIQFKIDVHFSSNSCINNLEKQKLNKKLILLNPK